MSRPRPVGLALIALLALVQGSLGVLRAFDWFSAGIDLSHRGLIVLPLAGTLAFVRGGLIALIAVLYVLFALGAFTGRRWAWWVGLGAVLITLSLVSSVVATGEDVGLALFWAVIPVVMVSYLFTPAGRAALGR